MIKHDLEIIFSVTEMKFLLLWILSLFSQLMFDVLYPAAVICKNYNILKRKQYYESFIIRLKNIIFVKLIVFFVFYFVFGDLLFSAEFLPNSF